MFKSILQIIVAVFVTVQLTGCFFEHRDHHEHHEDHHDHDAGVDVHLHG